MVADLEVSQSPPLRGGLLTAAYVGLWLLLMLPLAALLLGGRVGQAEEEFRLRAAAVHHEVGARLKAGEATAAGVAVFARMAAADPEALRRYSAELLARLPHIHQVALLEQAEATAPGRLVFVYPELPDGQLRPGASGGELGPVLRQALAVARPVASAPFGLSGGEPAYLLLHPLDESGWILLLVRLRDLLPVDVNGLEGVTLALRHPAAGDVPLHVGQASGGERERLLFPRLSFVAGFESPAQPYALVAERQLGWELLRAPLLAAALAAILSLGGVLGYARAHLRRERAARRSTQRLYWLANYDSLTGLPNRNLLHDRLRQALSRARRRRAAVAILFIDLDGFKAVNDSAGHAAGDRLLVEVARRLRRCVREQDTVGRLSGDEFVVVLEDIGGRGDAERVVEEVRQCLRQPLGVSRCERGVGASIGIAVYPEDGEEELELLRQADQAMYRNKRPRLALPGQAAER